MSETLIGLLKLGDQGQYSRIERLEFHGNKDKLVEFENKIKAKLTETSNSRWDLALLLAELVRSGCWTCFYSKVDKSLIHGPLYSTHSASLFTFLKECFGLGRTTVYNYLEVVDTFCIGGFKCDKSGKKTHVYKISSEAAPYQFWQLVEMVSLSPEERKEIQPNWTREEIRAYKKELKEKTKPKKEIQPAEQVEPEEKPMTEAQVRFSKYSKDDLINEILKLEAELAESKKTVGIENKLFWEKVSLENEIVRLKASNPFAKSNRTSCKRDIQEIVEEFIKSYAYEIKLLGRVQGAKAFAGNIAGKIVDKYYVEPPKSKKVDSLAQEQLPV